MNPLRFPLPTLLLGSDANDTVCLDGSHTYSRSALLQAVAAHHHSLTARAEQRWLLVHDDSWHFAIGLLALLSAGKHVILPANAQPGTLANLKHRADALLGMGESQLHTLAIDANLRATSTTLPALDPAQRITLLTSGSSGEPQWIEKSLQQLAAEIAALEQCWGNTLGNAVIISTVSHQHIYGLLFRLLWPLCAGRAFVAKTHQYPETILAALQQHPGCALISSPAQLKRFAPESDEQKKLRVAAVFSSGGPLPWQAARQWRAALGAAPVEVFGSTETGGVAWRRQTHEHTAWQTLPGVDISVDDDHCLHVQSPWSDGEQIMGDRVELLNAEQFSLLGRADRIVKIEEKRLSLHELERHLLSSGLITEVAALVLPGARDQLAVVAVLSAHGLQILGQQGKSAVTEQLRHTLLAHVERILLPRKWRFVDELPLNPQGKITQAALAALFEKTA